MIRIIPRYYEDYEREKQRLDTLEELNLRIEILRARLKLEADAQRYAEYIRSNKST